MPQVVLQLFVLVQPNDNLGSTLSAVLIVSMVSSILALIYGVVRRQMLALAFVNNKRTHSPDVTLEAGAGGETDRSAIVLDNMGINLLDDNNLTSEAVLAGEQEVEVVDFKQLTALDESTKNAETTEE